MRRGLAGVLLGLVLLVALAPIAASGGAAIYRALQVRQGELEPFNGDP